MAIQFSSGQRLAMPPRTANLQRLAPGCPKSLQCALRSDARQRLRSAGHFSPLGGLQAASMSDICRPLTRRRFLYLSSLALAAPALGVRTAWAANDVWYQNFAETDLWSSAKGGKAGD